MNVKRQAAIYLILTRSYFIIKKGAAFPNIVYACVSVCVYTYMKESENVSDNHDHIFINIIFINIYFTVFYF